MKNCFEDILIRKEVLINSYVICAEAFALLHDSIDPAKSVAAMELQNFVNGEKISIQLGIRLCYEKVL